MNTINCRLKLNEYHSGPGKNITPAEALILRALHDPAGAMSGSWFMFQNPVPSGVAKTARPNPDYELPDILTDRTDAEEYSRLRKKYNVRAKSKAPGSHILEDMFPGINPRMPQTFSEIGFSMATVTNTPAAVVDLDAQHGDPAADPETKEPPKPKRGRPPRTAPGEPANEQEG
jgi:hypothetical protein